MGRLIDADVFVKKVVEYSHQSTKTIGMELDATPTVDAVQVVRCKDCKHRFVDGENVLFNCCDLNHNKVQSDDWFCADGERKDGEE